MPLSNQHVTGFLSDRVVPLAVIGCLLDPLLWWTVTDLSSLLLPFQDCLRWADFFCIISKHSGRKKLGKKIRQSSLILPIQEMPQLPPHTSKTSIQLLSHKTSRGNIYASFKKSSVILSINYFKSSPIFNVIGIWLFRNCSSFKTFNLHPLHSIFNLLKINPYFFNQIIECLMCQALLSKHQFSKNLLSS